ncbi:DEAD/DEAH box helicase [Bacillus sp. Marseille-P3661]|uniref:DEAD/DEAH box helicase n=1 Tax=Bacillus sp. Marseille-P3661 TaxID=1936234 RepID=UPI000C837341|nr:DEAD/DEAH box helicase [Bacillus sp. Marseille-P3661]
MIKQTTYFMTIDYLENDHFLMCAEASDQRGRRARIEEWKKLVFSWHAESYYGTALTEFNQGVLLTPWETLHFFANQNDSSLFTLQWCEKGQWLKQHAPTIFHDISSGQFKPDFQRWQNGAFGWSLMRNMDDFQEYPPAFSHEFIQKWISNAIAECITADPTLNVIWSEILEHYPLIEVENNESNELFNEEMWLESIGWQQDQAPFTVELRLSEPVSEEELDVVNPSETIDSWKLDIMLRDKFDDNMIIPLENRESLLQVPLEWHDNLDKVDKSLEWWCQIVPWLKNEDEEFGILQHLREDQAWNFLTDGSIQLAEAGVQVLLPSWWQEIKAMNPKLKIKLRSSVGSAQQSMLGLSSISEFDWKLATGDSELNEDDFFQMVEDNRRLIKVNGRWMKLDPSFVKQVKEIMQKVKKDGLSFQDVLAQEWLQAADSHDADGIDELDNPFSQIQVELSSHLEKLVFQLHNLNAIPQVEIPSNLHGELRPYQKQGVEWLLFLRKFGFGACLADDMGLGKTVQMITYFLYVKNHEKPSTPALIICPTSVLSNWQKELAKFSPSLKVRLHYGSNRKKGEDLAEDVKDVDIVLTSYGLSQIDEEDLGNIHWSTICLDEAQNIKNAFTKQSKAIRGLNGIHKIALTGTPIENRLTELWSIFDFMNKGYLGSLNSFTKRFVSPIEKNKDEKKVKIVQQLVKPFLLRRTKKDESVSLNLPDKQEQKEYIPLTVEQASLYEQLIQDTFERIEKLSGMERRGLILSMLTKLKQICNHPSLYLKDDLISIDESAVQRSHKMEKLMELTENIIDQQESCLIFTQYIGMGKLIQKLLGEHFREKVHFLQGSLTKQDRDKIIDSFQNGEQKLLILSLKAGGTGLNLTAANHVIHYDRWWNPAVENQATDRAYRIGQKRFVHVHKLITTGTLEEKIDEMIDKKQSLSDEIISGENWITELSTDELRDLFTLRNDWSE